MAQAVELGDIAKDVRRRREVKPLHGKADNGAGYASRPQTQGKAQHRNQGLVGICRES